MSWVMFNDGRVGLLGSDGFVDEFDAIEPPAIEGARAIGAAFIDIDPIRVVDSELPQRQAFVGPPAPTRMPDGLPTVKAMDRFVAAVREWGES